MTGVNARLPKRHFNALDLSLFVNNLFDTRPFLSYAAADKYSILYEATILRPRTFGLTATIRQ